MPKIMLEEKIDFY